MATDSGQDAVIVVVLLVLLAIIFMPVIRSVAGAFDSFENPGKQDTPEEQAQANSDFKTMLVVLVIVFGIAFVMFQGK